MQPPNKKRKYLIIALIVLVLGAFGLIDFRALFQSEPEKIEPVPTKTELKEPESFASQEKDEEKPDEPTPQTGQASVGDAGPSEQGDIVKPPPEKTPPPSQDDLAIQNSTIQKADPEKASRIEETDITAKDDQMLAKADNQTPPKTDESPKDKPDDATAEKPSETAADQPDEAAPADATAQPDEESQPTDPDMKTPTPEKKADAVSSFKPEGIVLAEGPGPYPYSVQTGSFDENNRAAFQKALRELKKKGLSPFWIKVDLGDKGLWHRVLLGCFSQRSEAEAMIRDHNLQGAIVANTRFAVRIGKYKDLQTLEKQAAALREKDFHPYAVKTGGDEYTLYVGAFYSKKTAQKTVDELTVMGSPGQVARR